MGEKLMQQALEAAEVLEKLFKQAEAMHEGTIPSVNVNCQITQSDLRKGLCAATALRERLAQPVQEPAVRWVCKGCGHEYMDAPTSCDCMESTEYDRVEYYTGPQPRQWQGLTDEDKAELDEKYGDDTLAHLDAIEAKLKEKNT